MEKELIISVIVPIYNAEKFLHRAVESVLCQMDGRIELILVDDGSTDFSGAICDEYASKHSDIQVVHKKNGGLSSARNAGIEVASGQYICFLDADDYLDKETCGQLIEVIVRHHPDMIDYGWKYVSSGGEVTANLHGVPKGVLLDECVIREMILPPLLNLCKDDEHFIYDFACTKVFKTGIVKEKNVRFDETRRIWEDRPFSVTYLLYCKTFYSVPQSFYNYVDMPNSLSRRYHLEFFNVILKNYHLYRNLYGEIYDFETQYVNDYWSQAIENMIFRSLEQKDNQEVIRSNILDTLRNEQVRTWYANRTVKNEFDQKINTMLLAGKYDEVLRCYEKKQRQSRRNEAAAKFTNRIKGVLRRLLRR